MLHGEADRARYELDQTGVYPGRTLAVARPANTQEVSETLAIAHRHGVPVVPVGGNTGLSGGTWMGNEGATLGLSLERLNHIREIKPEARVAIVEAGVILQSLHEAVAEHDLVFPLLFGARGSCTIGGNLSTNAGGSNVVRYGNTRALCLGLEVVLADGRVLDILTELHKDNTGYALKDLFIGAEGTLGVITAACVKLFPKPAEYHTAFLGFDKLADALSLLNTLQRATGGAVEAFEYMSPNYFAALATVKPDLAQPFDAPSPVNVLLEVAEGATGGNGAPRLAAVFEEMLGSALERGELIDAVIAQNAAQRATLWAIRESAYEVSQHRRPYLNCDICLPLDNVARYLDDMAASLPTLAPGAESETVSHLGDGNLHFVIWLDQTNNPDDPELKDRLMQAVEKRVTEYGGSFSAEHGIGVSKLPSMRRLKNPVALDVMASVKAALDPANLMNPGKVLPSERP
ncbi:MAG: FAD-binding oxidoreductase [Pseudomonadota bacterium]